MDAATQLFIENATLMFIASRNREGAMDISPRGGQPYVLRVTADGKLLLPDYQGNRRLDTIGNLLANPAVAIAVLGRGSSRFLRISAHAAVSFSSADLEQFPADENPPVAVVVLTPESFEFVESTAFAKGGMWSDVHQGTRPFDLGALIRADKVEQVAAGFAPIPKDAAEEELLERAGVRAIYGKPSEGVQLKVGNFAGPGGRQFLNEANFIVLAHSLADGGIGIDMSGEAPLSIIPFDNRNAFRLQLPAEVTLVEEGECALVAVASGRSELLRINGGFERDGLATKIVAREVFFHCSMAFSRSRIWKRDTRLCWFGKRRFTCVDRRQDSPDVTSFILRPVDNAPVGPTLPGQYVTVTLDDPLGVSRQRSYSISGRPDDRSLRLSVRRIGKNGVSDLMHDAVMPGSEMLLGVPAGRFVLSSPMGRPVVLVSAGVGITPVLPMLERLVEEGLGREIWFFHGARDRTHHLFRHEAQEIAGRAQADVVHLVSAYSRPAPSDQYDILGRIDAAAIASRLPVVNADFYICGPVAFMDALRGGLVALGAAPDHVHFEKFDTSGTPELEFSGSGALSACTVRFDKSDKTATWTPGKGSLLDLALTAGIDIQYSCRLGDCQSCVQSITGGAVCYPAGDEPLLGGAQILLCQAVPVGDVVIDC